MEVFYISSDEDDCAVMNSSSNSHSVFSCKRKKADENGSCTTMCRNTKGGRVIAETKKLKLAQNSSAIVTSEKSRVEGNKKADESAIIIVANTPEKRIVPVKQLSVVSYKKIPHVILEGLVPQKIGEAWGAKYRVAPFDTHASLAGKKVIICGIAGYLLSGESPPKWCKNGNMDWARFYRENITPPIVEFIEQAELLKANGVDQILFITVNSHVMRSVWRTCPGFDSWYPHLQFLCDINFPYKEKWLKEKCFIHTMGLREICEGWIPPRTPKFILLVDNLMVKYSNIESQGQKFFPPTAEEMIHAFRV